VSPPTLGEHCVHLTEYIYLITLPLSAEFIPGSEIQAYGKELETSKIVIKKNPRQKLLSAQTQVDLEIHT